MAINFQTPVKTHKSSLTINHSTPVIMIGSCFTDNIGSKLTYNKFDVLQNPFGVLYNPASIANAIKKGIELRAIKKEELIQHNNLWHSMDFHGNFSDINTDEVINNTKKGIEQLHHYLKNAKVLFISLGTAWVYEHVTTNKIVANCHKIPATQFRRFRLSVNAIVEQWELIIKELKNINPDLQLIFTVSPVRHLKDGAHENQLSKSTLFLAIDALSNNHNHINYFPSYEIINDELRDYRFYEADMVHISSVAVDYIFEKFGQTYFHQKTIECLNEIKTVIDAKSHRFLTSDKQAIKKFAESMINKIGELEKKHPFVNLQQEKQYFENL